jgi:hypothetical protein
VVSSLLASRPRQSRTSQNVLDQSQHHTQELDDLQFSNLISVEPLSFMGVADDLTSEARLNEDGISYIKRPSPDLDYFSLSIAKDPRPLIVHEGAPGHYFQGWRAFQWHRLLNSQGLSSYQGVRSRP